MGRVRQLRPIRIEGDIAYIPLTMGYEAIIDAADVRLVQGMNWHVRKASSGRNWYAGTAVPTLPTGQKTVLLHRFLTNAPAGMDVDHVDHDGLNNRRSNLRVCTHQQNMANMAARNPLGIKGVKRVGNRYAASIEHDGEWTYLGLYATPTEAGAAYRGASIILHQGDFTQMAG
jgi:hypothetical protein